MRGQDQQQQSLNLNFKIETENIVDESQTSLFSLIDGAPTPVIDKFWDDVDDSFRQIFDDVQIENVHQRPSRPSQAEDQKKPKQKSFLGKFTDKLQNQSTTTGDISGIQKRTNQSTNCTSEIARNTYFNTSQTGKISVGSTSSISNSRIKPKVTIRKSNFGEPKLAFKSREDLALSQPQGQVQLPYYRRQNSGSPQNSLLRSDIFRQSISNNAEQEYGFSFLKRDNQRKAHSPEGIRCYDNLLSKSSKIVPQSHSITNSSKGNSSNLLKIPQTKIRPIQPKLIKFKNRVVAKIDDNKENRCPQELIKKEQRNKKCALKFSEKTLKNGKAVISRPKSTNPVERKHFSFNSPHLISGIIQRFGLQNISSLSHVEDSVLDDDKSFNNLEDTSFFVKHVI